MVLNFASGPGRSSGSFRSSCVCGNSFSEKEMSAARQKRRSKLQAPRVVALLWPRAGFPADRVAQQHLELRSLP
jgi:hypothetical protein